MFQTIQSWNELKFPACYTTETDTFALAWPCCENGWRPDPKGFPLRRISSRKRPTGRPQLSFKDVRKRDLKALGMDINVQVGSKQCSKASRSPKKNLPNRLRQRDKRGRLQFREIDQQLTKSAHCEEGTVFPEWSFQPHKALFRNHQSERDTIVFRDWRMLMNDEWKIMLTQSMKAQPRKPDRLLKQDCIFTRSVLTRILTFSPSSLFVLR